MQVTVVPVFASAIVVVDDPLTEIRPGMPTAMEPAVGAATTFFPEPHPAAAKPTKESNTNGSSNFTSSLSSSRIARMTRRGHSLP
jgi:hypothetical protein